MAARSSAAILRLTVAYLAIACGVVVYGFYRLGQKTQTPGPRVAVVQISIPQSIKDSPSPEDKQATFDKHIALSRAALADRPDLIVWSETIVPAYINGNGWNSTNTVAQLNPPMELTESGRERLERARAYDAALASFSRSQGVPLLVGAPGRVPRGELLENLAILYTPSQGQSEYYLKRHLVPFGEYIRSRSPRRGCTGCYWGSRRWRATTRSRRGASGCVSICGWSRSRRRAAVLQAIRARQRK